MLYLNSSRGFLRRIRVRRSGRVMLVNSLMLFVDRSSTYIVDSSFDDPLLETARLIWFTFILLRLSTLWTLCVYMLFCNINKVELRLSRRSSALFNRRTVIPKRTPAAIVINRKTYSTRSQFWDFFLGSSRRDFFLFFLIFCFKSFTTFSHQVAKTFFQEGYFSSKSISY